MRKWRDIERAMAPINHLLHHGGMTNSDWFSEMLCIEHNKNIVATFKRLLHATYIYASAAADRRHLH